MLRTQEGQVAAHKAIDRASKIAERRMSEAGPGSQISPIHTQGKSIEENREWTRIRPLYWRLFGCIRGSFFVVFCG